MPFADIANLSDLVDYIPFDGKQLLGIPFALVGAVFLSLGAQFQHAGVGRVESDADAASATPGRNNKSSRLQISHLLSLLKRPSWLIGTVMLVLAIVFQLVSLAYSPLIVVQPIGAVALVITSIVN